MNTAFDSVSAAASAGPCVGTSSVCPAGTFAFAPMPFTARSAFDLQPEFRGDLLQRLAVLHPIRLPGHERLVRELQLGGKELGLVDGQEDRVIVRAGDDRAVVLRIEVQELVDRHLGELRPPP